MKAVLLQEYTEKIQPELQKSLGIKNPMQVPRIEKISVNIGMGSYLQRVGGKDYSFVENTLTRITGRKPMLKKARASISNFKLREGMPVGVHVTLRGNEAYDFLYKLINLVFPRVRDFRGVTSKFFDKDANCSFGLNDHTAFLEGITPEDSRKIHGVQIVLVTSTKNKDHSKALLDAFGFPFEKPQQ